jgi:hypothetical protein
VLTAVDAPVHEDVVEEAFLAAVADLGVGATAWADDGGAVPGTGDFAAFLVAAEPFVGVELDKTWLGRRVCWALSRSWDRWMRMTGCCVVRGTTGRNFRM